MSLKDADIKPTYRSQMEDVAAGFYVPVMKECIRFDRASCYFSSKALSLYSQGLYYLGKENRGTYRLLISIDVSEDDFNQIKIGCIRHNILDEQIRDRMRDKLTPDDEVNLSNLAYLISCGIVSIKFALVEDGLFHNKFGYAIDAEGNQISFTGSNNETAASIRKNIERFDTNVSWSSNEWDLFKIDAAKTDFELLWNNEDPSVITIDPPDIFFKSINTFNKEHLIKSKDELHDDAILLDLVDGALTLHKPNSITESTSSLIRKTALNDLTESLNEEQVSFKMDIAQKSRQRIYDKLKRYTNRKAIPMVISDEAMKLISSHSELDSLANLGRLIKEHDVSIIPDFNHYQEVVDSCMERPLRERQMWDSYFMYKMGNSANFSVPGAGKTAAVLGVYAYLHNTEGMRKIVVIGPLNSFDSWINEFEKTFGDMIELNVFDSRNFTDKTKKRDTLALKSGRNNLFLFNYEGLNSVKDILQDVIIDEKTLLVYDEVHRVKNVNGMYASNALSISDRNSRKIVMTGTPIPNSYRDIYNFLHILYKEEYDDYFEYNISALDNPDAETIEDINNKLQPFFCRTTKSQLNVPKPNDDDIIQIDATDVENEYYQRLIDAKINPLELIIRLLQLESDPSMLNKNLSENMEAESYEPSEAEALFSDAPHILTAKTAMCLNIAELTVNRGCQVIIWCIFKKSMTNLSMGLKKRGISCSIVNGSVTGDMRTNEIQAFRDGTNKVLITNPHTLAESISLHDVCHDAIYFEYSYNLVHLLQSKDRIHRLGLKNGQYTQYHYLQTIFGTPLRPSLDNQIYERLAMKENRMLQAIENNSLEPIFSTMDDVINILKGMGIDTGVIDGKKKSTIQFHEGKPDKNSKNNI